MTTDFLFLCQTEQGIVFKARSVKPHKELSKPRVLEKQTIEFEYWNNLRIDWGIVTEETVNNVESKNKGLFVDATRSSIRGIIHPEEDRIIEELLWALCTEDVALFQLTAFIENKYSMDRGLLITLFQKLVMQKEIPYNLNVPFLATKRVSELIDVEALTKYVKQWRSIHERSS
jgi:Ni,Fe-hydrogenase maturation factor